MAVSLRSTCLQFLCICFMPIWPPWHSLLCGTWHCSRTSCVTDGSRILRHHLASPPLSLAFSSMHLTVKHFAMKCFTIVPSPAGPLSPKNISRSFSSPPSSALFISETKKLGTAGKPSFCLHPSFSPHHTSSVAAWLW